MEICLSVSCRGSVIAGGPRIICITPEQNPAGLLPGGGVMILKHKATVPRWLGSKLINQPNVQMQTSPGLITCERLFLLRMAGAGLGF